MVERLYEILDKWFFGLWLGMDNSF